MGSMSSSRLEEHPRSSNNNDDGASTAASDASSPATAAAAAGHPYDFHVSGPRNLSSPNWRDLFRSSWKDSNYKRMVMACFIQAVYLLELDRQDGRSPDDGLAPKWWKPFKYKLAESLIDERDGSIYGAVLEWDRASAVSDLVLLRPVAAPRAVLALRGTLLRTQTMRRDIEDDLRFMAWETLKGSVRFDGALRALRSMTDRFGSSGVCVAGHSLGAGFALQIGKAMAKQGELVECHLFNPPSMSLAMSLRIVGERAGSVWNRVRALLPSYSSSINGRGGIPATEEEEKKLAVAPAMRNWAPLLYVNDSDYICCHYTAAEPERKASGGDSTAASAAAPAKLFVASKGPKSFLEAHGLQQWWSDDVELKEALHRSKLIDRQLRSLYQALPEPPAKF